MINEPLALRLDPPRDGGSSRMWTGGGAVAPRGMASAWPYLAGVAAVLPAGFEPATPGCAVSIAGSRELSARNSTRSTYRLGACRSGTGTGLLGGPLCCARCDVATPGCLNVARCRHNSSVSTAPSGANVTSLTGWFSLATAWPPGMARTSAPLSKNPTSRWRDRARKPAREASSARCRASPGSLRSPDSTAATAKSRQRCAAPCRRDVVCTQR